jgi:class 3 adenylate cyclase
MRRLVVSEFITLDGVIEAPGFEDHRAGRNAWALRFQNEETQQFKAEELYGAGAILLGRTTYQIFALFWPDAPDDEFTRAMNDTPKYVVSKTLKQPAWSNTTILRGELGAEVAKLKEQSGRDILVYGSADLVAGLMKLDLVDEIRFMVFPVILGSGKRLFRDDADLKPMQLVSNRSFASGAVLLTYEPGDELPSSRYVEEFRWTQEQVRSLHAAQDTDRVLATVLFTDIVGSTERAATMGDHAWRQLLDRHDEMARSEVGRWHGEFVKSTGDGILATFDTPTRALRCAFGLREALGDLELEIRAAIHTGEIEMRDGDIGGIGIHIASRALQEATGHAVVVTRTVRDLATGTDLSFAPLGSVGLRGVPGQWELFEVSIGS